MSDEHATTGVEMDQNGEVPDRDADSSASETTTTTETSEAVGPEQQEEEEDAINVDDIADSMAVPEEDPWDLIMTYLLLRDPRDVPKVRKFIRRQGQGYRYGVLRYNIGMVTVHPATRLALLILVVIQVVLAGVQADNPSEGLSGIRLFLSFIMLFEQAVQIGAFGRAFFFDIFNIADLWIVVISWFVSVIWCADDNWDQATFGHRFLRSLTVLPVLRICNFLEPLSKLSMTFVMCAYQAMGLLILVICFVYMFAVICTNVIGNDPIYRDDPDVQSQYGSVHMSMWTLTVKNLELPDNSEELQDIPCLWIFFFTFYILTIIGILNMAIGILGAGFEAVEEEEQSNEAEECEFQQEELRKKLAQIFAALAQSATPEDGGSHAGAGQGSGSGASRRALGPGPSLARQKRRQRTAPAPLSGAGSSSDSRGGRGSGNSTRGGDPRWGQEEEVEEVRLPDDSGVLDDRGDEEFQIPMDSMMKFLNSGVLNSDSQLAVELKKLDTEPLALVKALDFLDAIDGSKDGKLDYRDFINEIFRLSKYSNRLDVLEILAECKRTTLMLTEVHENLDERKHREDSDAEVLRGQVQDQAKTIDTLRDTLHHKQTIVTTLQKELESMNNLVAAASSGQNQQVVSSLQNELQHKSRSIESLQKDVVAKDRKIEELDKELRQTNNLLRKSGIELADKREETKSLRREVQSQKEAAEDRKASEPVFGIAGVPIIPSLSGKKRDSS